MTLLTKTTPWAFQWLGPLLRIFVSIRSIFDITCVKSSNISDPVLSSCFSGARIDLSAEDNAIALALAECPGRPYVKLIRSGIPGPSSSKSARSSALRSSPPSTMRVSPIGPSAANPTKGSFWLSWRRYLGSPRV